MPGRLLMRVFQRANGLPLPNRPKAGQFWYGRVGGEKGDEVILSVRAMEPGVWTEYHCHGGKIVTEWLMKLLLSEECKPIGWGDFVAQWEDRSCKDRIPLRFLPEAKTVRTAAILLDQYHGAYLHAVQEAVAALDAQMRSKKQDDHSVNASLCRCWNAPDSTVEGCDRRFTQCRQK